MEIVCINIEGIEDSIVEIIRDNRFDDTTYNTEKDVMEEIKKRIEEASSKKEKKDERRN